MLPSEMSSMLGDAAAFSGLPVSDQTSSPAAFLDISPGFSAEEQIQMEQLSGGSDPSGAILDLSPAAQAAAAAAAPEEQLWDPTADPANPQFLSSADATENWIADPANPDFWPQ